MSDFRIRPATPSDVPAIRAIAGAAYAPYVPLIGREPAPMIADFDADVATGHADVALIGDTVAGYIVHRRVAERTWLLENVAVAPDTQGTGLGRALIANAEAAARAEGATEITLYTNAKMEANQALYPRLGYVEIRRATEDGFDRVFYRKAL